MTLVAGSYERFLFGYAHPENSSVDDQQLSRAFTYAAHKGVVKSLAAAGPFIASGGADDLIHLYNLKDGKDLGFLMNPAEGSVTSLQFFVPPGAFAPTNLLAGCSDGTLSVWKAGGGWECMKTLRGHRRDITGITIHPSGLVALTTSLDGTLRLWDLAKGRTTFTTKVEGGAEGVAFSPSGKRYALQTGTAVAVRTVGEAAGAGTGVIMPHPRRVLSMAFGSGDEILITGAEDGSLRVWDVNKGKEILSIPRAHASRIKAMTLLRTSSEDTKARSSSKKRSSGTDLVGLVPEMLATASSDGVIKVWALRPAVAAAIKSGKPEAEDGGGAGCICQAETRARLTTLCCLDTVETMIQKAQEAASLRVKQQQQQQQQQQQKAQKDKQKQAGAALKKGVHGKNPDNSLKNGVKAVEGKQGAAAVGTQKGKKGAATALPTKKVTTDKKKEVVEPRKRDGSSAGGVVSFMDEEDALRQRKKQRQVQLNAQRAAGQRAGQKRRTRAPGAKDARDE